MPLQIQIIAHDVSDAIGQMTQLITELSIGRAGFMGAVPPPGAASHWEQARRLGFQQGFAEACDRATMADKLAAGHHAYPRPEGVNDYLPMENAADAAEKNRAANQTLGQLRQKQAYPVPGTGDDEMKSEAAEWHGYTRSVADPESVAETLRQQRHPLPGE